MFATRKRMIFAVLAALLPSSVLAQVEDITAHVPKNALGFVVIRDLTSTSSKLENLSRLFEAPVPAPLAFFKIQTGFGEGFNDAGDLLVALLPAQDEFGSPGPLALVSVTDYGAFVSAFEGDPSGEICRVTVSDEEVLVAQKGEYALFMNLEYRDQMQAIVSGNSAAADSVVALGDWHTTNNGTLVLLPEGAKMLVAMGTQGLAAARNQMEQGFQELEMEEELQTMRAAFEMYGKALSFVGDEVTSAALGLAIDEEGNVTFGIRAVGKADGQIARLGEIGSGGEALAGIPAGPFVAAGGGPWPAGLSDAMLRFSMDTMKSLPAIYGLQGATEEDLQKLEESFVEAMQGLHRISFFMQPGQGDEPLYSNIYMLVEADSAEAYIERYTKSMAVWSEIASKGEQSAQFEYSVTEETVAGKPGMAIAMDLTKAMGTADFPQARQMMEKMFGADGKMRAYVGQVDENRVVVGYAPKPNVEHIVEGLREGKAGLASSDSLAVTSKLLPADAPVVTYVSPQGCVDWFRRMMNVMMGAFGGGGPVILEYPQTPPVGIASDLEGRVVKTDIVLPREMLQGLSNYIKQHR